MDETAGAPILPYNGFPPRCNRRTGSSWRIVFTYIAKDFVDGERPYGQERLYKKTRVMWRFGLQPSQGAAFIGEYS